MAKGLIWATADDLARNRGQVLSLYRQLLRSLNSPNLPLNLAARLSKKAEVRAIFMLASEDRSLHNIEDLIDAAEYSLSLLRKDEIPKQNGSSDADARKVFEQSPQLDLVSWTTLIQAYVGMGYWKEGVEAFFRMCEGKMIADERTMVVVLSACAKLGDLSLGRKIHEYMCDHEVNFNVFVGNALLDMYLKCGDADFARKVFNRMPLKNVVSWNSIIIGLTQQGEYKEALNVFQRMQREGVKPDDYTLVGVLNLCAYLGVLEVGTWVHEYVNRNCIKADGFIGNTLIDMYAKCGSIDEAFKVFNDMKGKDVYTYTTMVVGFAMHGKGKRALEVFYEMPRVGIEPNDVTYVGVLMACCHAGLVEEGCRHFVDMLTVHNLKPQTEHYGCMVDLFDRAGLYLRRRWSDALKLRKEMKGSKIKKTHGCSLIELDGVVHEFRKGDKAHPKAEEIYMLLDEMKLHLTSSNT
ncbi:hypothetical protein RJ639_038720 [Escallonia herrerae]|uniref:LYR motif containing domain-containing protein n=1 Tax=Escallonia herrerae TaxID=1293975 RepID=A0AA89B6V1_9ASTE|nr:hypothetical protein RJ639_038720 [Escallonia herrerae]